MPARITRRHGRWIFHVLAILVLLYVPDPVRAQQGQVEGLEASPTLSAWAARLASGDSMVEAEFWEEVRDAGVPLVEPDSAHGGYSTVTFLARGAPGVDRMRVQSNLTSILVDGSFPPPDSLGWMSRLDDTDVWYRSFRLRDDLRVPYLLATYGGDAEPSVDVDPLNPLVWEPGVDALRASVLELNDAPPQPWRNPSGEEGDGDWDELTDDESGRSVYVYKPVQWDPDGTESYHLLVGLGAFGHGVGMRVDRMVDELIGAERLPPMIVALVDLTRDDETSNYGATGDFILDELLPYLREQYRATTDPQDIVVSGTSRRGMVASLLALEHPETFGNVLSLSGSYYWRPADVEAYEWVPMRYAIEERRPVRFYVAAGKLETFVSPGNRGHYLLATNRHMRDVLIARDYDLEYIEFNGVHSELNWQDWLAAGLVHLLGTDPAAAGAQASNDPVRSPRGVEAESASALRNAPAARAHHQLTSLPGGGIVLVGGSTRTDSGYVWFDDVWTHRFGVWRRDDALPFRRSSHALAYDGARETLLLFGGIEGGPAPADGRVWIRAGHAWRAHYEVPEQGWAEAASCYDRGRERVVIFGGWDRNGQLRADTWEWDGSQLGRVAASGPEARAGHEMSWDPVGERCLLFGGRAESGLQNDTWAWNGTAWRRLDGEGPPPRWFFGMATADAWGSIILFGGGDDEIDLADTWRWDGSRWHRLEVEGPPARGMSRLAFDGEHVVLFGGRQRTVGSEGQQSFIDVSDTWRFDGDGWTEVR